MDNTELLVNNSTFQAPNGLEIGLPEVALQVADAPNICVIGVGGAGGNAINNMILSKLTGARFVAANTDAQVLSKSLTHERIQLGVNLTKGLGAGANPDVGRAAAEESQEKIKEALQGVNLLFIAAGMGKGTGTGASPVIAKIAQEMGILTVAVVIKPFNWEGPKKMRIADEGIEELTKYVDSYLVIPNENLYLVTNAQTSLQDAFKLADGILYQAVQSIIDLMMSTMDVHVDFSDFRNITKGMGRAIMGAGEAEGENRAVLATEKAIINPLLDVSMVGAKGVLIGLFGKQIGLVEVQATIECVREQVDEDANIIYGICTDDQMGDKLRVCVVATGIGEETEAQRAAKIKRLLEQPKEEIVVVPDNLQQQVSTTKPEAIFVPVNKSDSSTYTATQTTFHPNNIENNIQKKNVFIANAPKELPTEEQDKQIPTTQIPDLFTGIANNWDPPSKTFEINPPTEKEKKVAPKKESFIFNLIPGLSGEKKTAPKAKNKLPTIKMNGLDRQLPSMSSEEELDIPAFFSVQDKP